MSATCVQDYRGQRSTWRVFFSCSSPYFILLIHSFAEHGGLYRSEVNTMCSQVLFTSFFVIHSFAEHGVCQQARLGGQWAPAVGPSLLSPQCARGHHVCVGAVGSNSHLPACMETLYQLRHFSRPQIQILMEKCPSFLTRRHRWNAGVAIPGTIFSAYPCRSWWWIL